MSGSHENLLDANKRLVRVCTLVAYVALATIAILLAVLSFSSEAEAEDCYVMRFSYTTSIRCRDGDTLIQEDNTRDRYGRRDDMPSLRRERPMIYEDRSGTRYCSQTGSIYSCR